MFDLKKHSRTRKNILTGDWILVSSHRMQRSWQGNEEDLPNDERPCYAPTYSLCPYNKRSDGTLNPPCKNPFVFTNDFSALITQMKIGAVNMTDLFEAEVASAMLSKLSTIHFKTNHV